jgi:hypothetical protein
MKQVLKHFARYAVVALILSSVTLIAQAGDTYFSSMYTFPVHGPSGIEIRAALPIANSEARLFTRDGGALMTIHATDLTPGDVVTSWWVIFNDPSLCSDGVCGENDVLPPPGNQEASVAVIYGDGALIGQDGTATFLDSLGVGHTEGLVFGPGLVNPLSAEIHYVLRTHGPFQVENATEQRTTLNGGCDSEPPHAPCVDIQFAVFKQVP